MTGIRQMESVVYGMRNWEPYSFLQLLCWLSRSLIACAIWMLVCLCFYFLSSLSWIPISNGIRLQLLIENGTERHILCRKSLNCQRGIDFNLSLIQVPSFCDVVFLKQKCFHLFLSGVTSLLDRSLLLQSGLTNLTGNQTLSVHRNFSVVFC